MKMSQISDKVIDLFGGEDREPERKPAPPRPPRKKATKDRWTLPLFSEQSPTTH
jgi:hypothetical protein